MYIKIIASIMIFISFSIIGFYYAYKEIYRKNDLLEMKRAILLLTSEIKLLSSIEEAVIIIEKDTKGAIKDIFSAFRKNIEKRLGDDLYEIWENAIITGSINTYLSNEDKKNIAIIGKVIGGIDKEFSIDALDIVIDYIEKSVAEIDREKGKNMKMYKSLGIFSGLAIIILLI